MADKDLIIGHAINVTGMIGVSAGIVLFASLIGRLGSSAFRLSTNSSIDVALTKALVWGFLSQAG